MFLYKDINSRRKISYISSMKNILLTIICFLNFTFIYSQSFTIDTVYSANDTTIQASELQNIYHKSIGLIGFGGKLNKNGTL